MVIEEPAWVPDAGDIIWLQFNPRAGHEQAGHRPAVVLSPASYNRPTGMLVCCRTATRIKGYVFEVALPGHPTSVALADHGKRQDWRVRSAKRKGRVSPAVPADIRGRLAALTGIETG